MEYNQEIRKKGLFSRKAQVEVVTVMLILGITVAAVFAAYQFAAPQIERSRDVSRINSMQKAFLELNNKIREVRFEGQGAQRYIDINFDKGNIKVDQNDDTIMFFMSAPGIDTAPQESSMETYFTGRVINIKLQYGGEIEILSTFQTLNSNQYRIYIKNEGGNDVLLSLTPQVPITGDTWTLQGYVYDNNMSESSPETDPVMDTFDPPLPNAEIIFLNKNLETIAITRTNSQGRYAVKLPQSDGPNDLELYIKVNLASYVMKENEGSLTVYTKTDLYKKGFKKDSTPWVVNINPTLGKDINDFRDYYTGEGFLNIPMYKLSKQDIFQSVPIALIMYADGPTAGGYRVNSGNEFGHILYDIIDAFDSSAGSAYNCNYFVVYGAVTEPVGLLDKNGNPINYPNTTINVNIYPIEWLFDPLVVKNPTDYSALNPIFADIASIDGNPDILNYRDFSLIIVGSGSANDPDLLPELHAYRNNLTNFLSLNRLSFKGVDYSRGLVTFGQFSVVNATDPDEPDYMPYPSLETDLDPPKIQNLGIVPDGQDGQNPSEYQHPLVWVNDYGGRLVFYVGVKDASDIMNVGINVEKDGVIEGGTILYDDGRAPDRIAGDGTFSAEWLLPYDLVDGTYLVSVKSTDEHGNYIVRSTFPDPDNSYLPSPFQLELKKDSVSPTNSSSLTSSLPILTTSPYTRISSSVSDALSGVERSTYGLGAQEIKYESNPAWLGVHTYYNYISISEGNIDYYVDTYDRAQNKLTQTIKIIVDTTEPVVSSKEPQGAAANSTPVIISEYNDLGSVTKGSRLYLDGAYLTSAGLNSNMISFTPAAALADGTHTSTVYVEDILGNFVVDYWNFYVNNEGPTVNITHPQYFLTFTRNASIDVSGTTPVTGNVSLDVNAVNISTVAGPDFNFVGVPLNAGLNNIRVEADGDPAGDQNNTFATRWVIRDNSAPSLTINSPTTVTPQNVRSGFPAYITFTYNESYPASYNIKLFDGATLKNQAPVTINNANVTNVKAGGTHQIMGAITIPSNLPDGLYDINITMIDLAGNVGSSPVSNDIIRVKNTGPSLTNETPANNAIAIPTAPIKITIKDTIAGVDRNSIRMFIYGQSYSNSSVINMEVTDSLDISPVADGYEVRYKPSWPWENTNKINVSVEATDKIGNKSSMSWYYITTSNSPVIDSLSMENHRIAEGEDAYINLVVSQCSNEAITYDAIKEINITVGKLGKIVYVPDGAGGNAKLVRTSDSLPGSPSEITVSYTAGGCSGGNLFRYSFTGASRISFKVPEYAGDVSNRIFVTTVNDDDWESYSETYLITSKQKYIEVPNTYYYGKYSWLPTFQGLDLSIGRVSNEPVGTEYEIYGQTNDAHRMIPVGYAGWTKERIAGNIVTEQWSGILYIDNKGDKIQWDHGRIPTVFEFDPDASTSQTWPPGGGGGPPFLPPDWLTLSMDLDLATRQYNIQKYSLENPIVNILPDEFAMCAHGYFDITDTGWANSNVLLNLKSFPKILQERGDPPTETLPPGLAKKLIGGSVFVPQANGGPVLLVKERRNIYDSLEACIVVTTMDLDRYKNNRNTVNGKDMHPSEVYSGSARDLEENIIVYACGHELIID